MRSERRLQDAGADDIGRGRAEFDPTEERVHGFASGARPDATAIRRMEQAVHVADGTGDGQRTTVGSDGGSDQRADQVRPSAASVTSQQLSASLARLETKSVEVNLSLDSISQWISRMEPRRETCVEEAGGAQTSADAAHEESNGAAEAKGEPVRGSAKVAAGPVTERRRRAQGVPVERRRTAHTPVNTVEDAKPWAVGDLLPAAARRRWIPITAAAFAVVLLAVLLVPGSRPTQPAPVSTTDEGPVVTGRATPAPAKASADVPLTAGGDVERRGATPAPAAGSSVGGGALDHGVGSAQTGTPVQTSPQTWAGSQPGAAGPADGLTGSSDTTGNQALGTEGKPAAIPGSRGPGSAAMVSSGLRADGTTAAPIYRRVNVSSGVMAGNLIYSPQPAYPKGIVGLFHPQGEVVLQAIISRRGHVENLRVISGHFMLRGAAKNAVRTWRYRPYLVNGTAVEVATIVSVEFHR